MKVTREKIGNKGIYSYNLSTDEKHVTLGLNARGDFTVSLVYDDEKTLIFEDDFEIKKEDNTIIYSLFDELYKSCEKYIYDGLFDNGVIFDSYGSTISLMKEKDKYLLDFTKDYGKISNTVSATLFNNCKENGNFIKTFIKMQEYDPKIHQISMNEYIKTLKRKK